MFVRWDCGCKGLHLAGEMQVVVDPCDSDVEGLMFRRRDMSASEWTRLPDKEADELVSQLERLVGQGYRLQDIAAILKSV